MLKTYIPITEAKEIILSNVKELPAESIATTESYGRYVSEDIVSPFNLPASDNSAMDGFAVSSNELLGASKDSPITLKIIDEIYAGKRSELTVTKGTCVRIFTGAKMPKGADAVVRQEDVKYDNNNATFFSPVEKGTDIREAGDDVKKGQIILTKGTKITPAAIGLLAALNIHSVKVFKRPKVYILATGNELIELGKQLSPNKIVNSNSYALSTMVMENGGVPIYGGIATDSEETIMAHFEKAKEADIVITTGGVSVGEYDLVKDSFAKKGVEWLFWKVKIRPGQPVAFGRYNSTLFFGLPGNPVSAMVTFDQFVRPAILKMMGNEKAERMRFFAISTDDIKKKQDRTHFLRARLFSSEGELYVEVKKNQSSAAISTMLDANCYIILEENKTKIKKGDKVLVEVFKI